MTTTLAKRTAGGLRSLLSRDPFRALQEEVDELIERFESEWNGDRLKNVTVPSLDLSEGEETLEVRMDLPGVKPEDINIEVSGNTLRVSGERREEKEEKGRTWHRVERETGAFARLVSLPCPVEEDKVTAEYHDGVLTITLPKTASARTRKIKVNA